MVVGTLKQVPSRGRISVMRIQNFTVQKRHSVIKLAYGLLLVVIGTIMAAIDPVNVITTWYLDMKEGSYIYNMWENPTYELMEEVWVFNYTNVPQYLSGEDKVMKVKEVGPFLYREMRTNEDMTIDRERGVMTMTPRMHLKFIKEESLDDPENVHLTMPNIALINNACWAQMPSLYGGVDKSAYQQVWVLISLPNDQGMEFSAKAISTLAADKLGYLVNTGAYYSMSALGSKVFKNLTADQILWGYHDPLVTIANGILPGWIDFKKLGLLDRLYPDREELAEVELKNASRRYSLNSWNNSTGLKEQGFTDWNTSTLCNRIKGTYEGIMLPANFKKGENFTIFRKQACRTFPFNFVEETTTEYGFNSYKYMMDETAFSRSSPHDCKCTNDCLPEGFIDIGSCYYGFPIAITKPHFMDTDPLQNSYFEGMTPSVEKHSSYYELEPTIGAPLKFAIKVQINLAVRMSAGNPITAPVKNKILPLIWFQLFCRAPPSDIITLLKLRLVYGPPLCISIIVFLFLAGVVLGSQGFYRIWKPRYKIIPPCEPLAPIVRRKSQERRRSSVHENIAFKEDDDLAKEAVSLLAIHEEEGDFVELIISEENEFEV